MKCLEIFGIGALKNDEQSLNSSKLQFDKVRGATTQFIFAYGFRCDWLGNRRIIPFSLMFLVIDNFRVESR